MANLINPITGNENCAGLELADGSGRLIVFDLDDGLCFGDGHFPPGVEADKVFQSRFGYERPQGWREYLQKIADTPNADSIPDIHTAAAADVLSDSPQTVFVTNSRIRNIAAELGVERAVDVAANQAYDPDTLKVAPLMDGKTRPDELSPTSPPNVGPNTAETARAQGEAASLAARAKVDALSENPDAHGAGADANADTSVAGHPVGEGEGTGETAPEGEATVDHNPGGETVPEGEGQHEEGQN